MRPARLRDHAVDAIGSTDMEHHDVTVRYLDGKMARFLSNAEIRPLRRDGSAWPLAPDGERGSEVCVRPR